MRLGVPMETVPEERRVALVPEVVKKFVAKGVEVVVEPGAGEPALIPDGLYESAGAQLGDPWSADVVVKVAAPSADEVARLGGDSILVGFLAPLTQGT
ncbi:MAG: NAD(P)(+) transhydrogenase (Re/Si-specific) subunit alpha, partial [Actinomycetota bacterium]|nr:NAD(P)(+) transhydrogenase (Re/Si-specific) subunit alpha [Actinomycetota bacterium]